MEWIKDQDEEAALKQINIEINRLEAEAEDSHAPTKNGHAF